MALPIDIMKDATANTLGTPIANKIGRIIIPTAMTTPDPKELVKIAHVTMDNKIHTMRGLSPPNSTALRMIEP